MRKFLLGSAFGAASVVASVYSFGVAAATPGPSPEEAVPPSAVETFEYPNADKILKEQGIILRKGDGHLLLSDCSSSTNVVVLTRHNKEGKFCFKVTGNGKSGYLALEIPQTFNILTEDYAVQAKLTSNGATQIVDVPRNGFKNVGEGTVPPGAPAVLVELRITS